MRTMYPAVTVRGRTRGNRWTLVIPSIVAGLLAGWMQAEAAVTPEQKCLAGRAKALARYTKCVHGEVARYYEIGGVAYPDKLAKCSTKYGATWARLQAASLASPATETCDAPRFIDGGDGTVTDNLSGLQWEKKTDDATVHDQDNLYTWSAGGTAGDGTVYVTFLPTLNGAGFAGQHDWRLPTLAELLGIVQPAYPNCSTPPCIDPTFGPTDSTTAAAAFWTVNTFLQQAWYVGFDAGYPGSYLTKTTPSAARAVRGGF